MTVFEDSRENDRGLNSAEKEDEVKRQNKINSK